MGDTLGKDYEEWLDEVESSQPEIIMEDLCRD